LTLCLSRAIRARAAARISLPPVASGWKIAARERLAKFVQANREPLIRRKSQEFWTSLQPVNPTNIGLRAVAHELSARLGDEPDPPCPG
jgi:hypothetical protein